MCFWWSLCTLYVLTCQVRSSAGDSGLCCCVRVTYFEDKLTPLVCWFFPFVSPCKWTPGQMAVLCRSPLSWSLLLDVLGVVRLLYNHWSVLGVTNVSCVMACAAAEVRGARRARNTGGWHRWHSQGWVPETPRRHVPEIIVPQQIWKTAHSLMALLVYSLNCAL